MSKLYAKPAASGEEPLATLPRYNIDDLDRSLVDALRSERLLPDAFDYLLYERIVDCLEEGAERLSENVVSSECVERLRDSYAAALPEERVLGRIIEHWRGRRRGAWRRPPSLRHEDLGKIGADPYVCFRRREIKIPRKTRRSDAQITDRLRKLHLDLSSTRLLLQASIKRDRFKREALVLEGELFEKYRLVDSWRKHHKSEWPPHLPTFKTAAQSLLEPKKKRVRVEGGSEDADGGAHGYKIAIPVAALKGSRHAKGYYTHEVGRLVQKDIDSILGHGHEASDFRGAAEFACGEIEGDLWGQDFAPASWLGGRAVSLRRGRGGRLIADRPRSDARSLERSLVDLPDEFYTRFQIKLLGPKDFTQLQTPVGNYNVHAVQTANQILRPMSYQAWVASTAPIIQALASGAKAKSPKKKRSRPAEEAEGSVPAPASAPTPTTASADALGSSVEITKLRSNSQITVKVKSRPKEPQRKGTGARFTPHGLAPDGLKAITAVTTVTTAADPSK